ncbi:MAG: KEOPS complex subunit Pcc1 [Candidatus Bathyarchaeia archaeon]
MFLLSARAKAIIRLKLRSQEQLATLLKALDPEAKGNVSRRASVTLEANGLSIVLAVDAEDTVALRATLNAYLRWISTALNVIDVVSEA